MYFKFIGRAMNEADLTATVEKFERESNTPVQTADSFGARIAAAIKAKQAKPPKRDRRRLKPRKPTVSG
jgi:hypothetical protein